MRTSAKSALGRKKEQAEFKKNQSEPELMQQNLDKKLVASLKPKGLPYWKQMRYVSRVLSKKEKGIINFLIFLIILSMSYWGYTYPSCSGSRRGIFRGSYRRSEVYQSPACANK